MLDQWLGRKRGYALTSLILPQFCGKSIVRPGWSEGLACQLIGDRAGGDGMRGFVSGLINRKRDLRAIRIYISAQAVSAVVLGAHARRLSAGRFGRGGACEIDGFNDLPLFSKLIIWSAGRATRSRTGLSADDSAHLERASTLAASVAPSHREAQQLVRLAREEADRIVKDRWAIVVRLADALEQRGHLQSDQIVKIVLQPKVPKARRRRPARARRESQPAASRMAAVVKRWGAALGAAATRSRARLTAAASAPRANPDGQASAPAMPVLTASEH